MKTIADEAISAGFGKQKGINIVLTDILEIALSFDLKDDRMLVA